MQTQHDVQGENYFILSNYGTIITINIANNYNVILRTYIIFDKWKSIIKKHALFFVLTICLRNTWNLII
jgi:hypothetical protein